MWGGGWSERVWEKNKKNINAFVFKIATYMEPSDVNI